MVGAEGVWGFSGEPSVGFVLGCNPNGFAVVFSASGVETGTASTLSEGSVGLTAGPMAVSTAVTPRPSISFVLSTSSPFTMSSPLAGEVRASVVGAKGVWGCSGEHSFAVVSSTAGVETGMTSTLCSISTVISKSRIVALSSTCGGTLEEATASVVVVGFGGWSGGFDSIFSSTAIVNALSIS